ncbi:MAG: hypothetical protein OEN50_06345, partial [Deltaproteobacteria bacterium]|nr:hypothetical protein [Deltaproteobacteria bacterium]
MPENKTYEDRDLRPKVVGVFAAALVALTVFTLLAMGWLISTSSPRGAKTSPMAFQPEQLSASPGLQVSPGRDLMEMRAMEERQLNSYQWVDPAAGIASIPIERAKDLIVERGLPVRGSRDEP